jgi:hypothetical protein
MASEGDSGRGKDGEFGKWPMSGSWQRVGMRGIKSLKKKISDHLWEYAEP